jgi:hypothetical protein
MKYKRMHCRWAFILLFGLVVSPPLADADDGWQHEFDEAMAFRIATFKVTYRIYAASEHSGASMSSRCGYSGTARGSRKVMPLAGPSKRPGKPSDFSE